MNEPLERSPFGRICPGCGTRVSMTADGEDVSDQTPCPVCGEEPPTQSDSQEGSDD